MSAVRQVAHSCKGRGICPPCGGRRMASTALHIVRKDDALQACRNAGHGRGRFDRMDPRGRSQQELLPDRQPQPVRRRKSPLAARDRQRAPIDPRGRLDRLAVQGSDARQDARGDAADAAHDAAGREHSPPDTAALDVTGEPLPDWLVGVDPVPPDPVERAPPIRLCPGYAVEPGRFASTYRSPGRPSPNFASRIGNPRRLTVEGIAAHGAATSPMELRRRPWSCDVAHGAATSPTRS